MLSAIKAGHRFTTNAFAGVLLAGCLIACGAVESDTQKLSRANEALARGDLRLALIEFKNLQEKSPENPAAVAGFVSALISSGDVVRAREAYDQGAASATVAPGLVTVELELLAAENSWQELIDAAARLSKDRRRSVRIDTLVARSYQELGQPDTAAKLLDAAIRQNPGDTTLIAARAQLEFERGRIDESLSMLARARSQLQDPRLTALEATLLLRIGRTGEAETLYKAGLDMLLNSPLPALRASMLVGLSEAQIGLGKLNLAEKSIQEARELVGEINHLQEIEVRLAAARGDAAGALARIEKLRKSGQAESIACLAGVLHLQLDEKAAAERELSSCIEKDPSNVAALKTLARLQLKRGKNAAEGNLARLRGLNPFDLELIEMEHLGGEPMTQSARAAAIESRFAMSKRTATDRISAARSLISLQRGATAASILRENMEWGTQKKARQQLLLVAMGKSTPRAEIASAASDLVTQFPEEPATYLLASSAMQRVGDFVQARRYLDAGLSHLANSPELFEARGYLALADGDFDALRVLTERAKRSNVTSTSLILLEGRVELAQGRPENAVELLEAAQATTPSPQLELELARTVARVGNLNKARSLVGALSKKYPALDAEMNALSAEILLREGKPQEAVTILRKVANAAPDSSEAKLRLGTALAAAGDLSGASESLRQALKLSPASTAAATLLVRTLTQRGQYEQARVVARKLAERLPGKSAPPALEAYVMANANDLRGAANLLRRAYQIEPGAAIALQLYGVEQKLGSTDSLRVLRDEWSRGGPQPAIALALSEALASGGKRSDAIEILEAASQGSGPAQAAILNNLAWWYHEARDPRARKVAASAAALAPEDPNVMDTYGWILVEEGALEQGLALLRKAHQRGGNVAEISRHLAHAEGLAGNRDRAKSAASAAIAANPSFASDKSLAELLK